jgi:hypothetical protein
MSTHAILHEMKALSADIKLHLIERRIYYELLRHKQYVILVVRNYEPVL